MDERKPVPGSLPLLKAKPNENKPAPKRIAPYWPNGTGSMSSKEDFEQNFMELEQELNFTKLQQARKRVEQMATAVRTDAFNSWVRCSVVTAETPAEWTPSRLLYASYLRHAKIFGRNRAQKGLAHQVAATETTFGRMMTTLFQKTRRTNAIYYPLRIKQGG
jgi:hypothetical protein